jgi:hypothetical protein
MKRICTVAALVTVSAGIAGSGSTSIAAGRAVASGTHSAAHVTVFASGFNTHAG